MEYLEKIKKEPRILLSVINVILFLFPWVSISSTFQLFGYTQNMEAVRYTGFGLTGKSFLMIIVLLIPLLFIGMNFFENLYKHGKLVYLFGSLAAIIFMILAVLRAAGTSLTGGGEDLGIEISVNRSIGFWLSLLSYIAIIAATLVIDFKLSRNVLKEKGFKTVLSETAGQVKSSVSGIADDVKKLKLPLPDKKTKEAPVSPPQEERKIFLCPSCLGEIPEEAVFCPKCGVKINEKRKCLNCGAEIPDDASFCSECLENRVNI